MDKSLEAIPHIEFKRDRQSGTYVPEISFPRSPSRSRVSVGSVNRYSDSPNRRRASADVSPLPTLTSFLSDPDQSKSHVRRSASRRVSECLADTQRSAISAPNLSEVPSFGEGDLKRREAKSSGLGQRDYSFSSSTPLRVSKDIQVKTESQTHDHEVKPPGPSAPPAERKSPSLDVLIFVCRHIIRPTMMWESTPQLIEWISQIELHRMHYVSEANRALVVNKSVRSRDGVVKLSNRQRKTLRLIAGEENAAALRKKYWRLTIFLRKTYLRFCLSLDPSLSRNPEIFDTLFPAESSKLHTLAFNHLSVAEEDELNAVRTACEVMAFQVWDWANAFRGTPEEAQQYFDQTWPMKPAWETSVTVLNDYFEEVRRIRNDLVSVFPVKEEELRD